MTITGPKVRDFTGSERHLRVEVVDGPVFELLVSLFVVSSHDEDDADYEVGTEWFRQVRSQASGSVLDSIDRLGCGEVWLALVGEAYQAGSRTVEGFVGHLREMDPLELRRSLLSMAWHEHDHSESEDAIERALAGDCDVEGAPECCRKDTGIRSLMSMPPVAARDLIVDVVTGFSEVLPGQDGIAAILARDADHKRAMAATMAPDRLVEVATNGITFALQPEVAGVVLIPSVIMRPWVVITEHGNRRIFCYPVAEEHLTADRDAPPSWLVQFYKALADERRLRILNVLSEGPATFGDLVERLDLAKSTVHHHIRTLRAAGLLRVTVGAEKEYSLRTDAVPEAARMLEGYLQMGVRRGDDRSAI